MHHLLTVPYGMADKRARQRTIHTPILGQSGDSARHSPVSFPALLTTLRFLFEPACCIAMPLAHTYATFLVGQAVRVHRPMQTSCRSRPLLGTTARGQLWRACVTWCSPSPPAYHDCARATSALRVLALVSCEQLREPHHWETRAFKHRGVANNQQCFLVSRRSSCTCL